MVGSKQGAQFRLTLGAANVELAIKKRFPSTLGIALLSENSSLLSAQQIAGCIYVFLLVSDSAQRSFLAAGILEKLLTAVKRYERNDFVLRALFKAIEMMIRGNGELQIWINVPFK